jgi:hypothetical protein
MLVPPLEAGESRELSIDVARPRPVPLGDFNRVPPRRLLAAAASPDSPASQPGNGMLAMLNLLRPARTARTSGQDLDGRASLAPDIWDLVGRDQPHWAGNINVFVGRQAVERHFARALRVYPGRTNVAMFLVGGSGRPDAYAFELAGLAPGWEAGLYDVSNRRSLAVIPADGPIEETKWVESNGGLMVMLAIHPPADCEAGNLEARVTRRSSGTTAVVEFNLDPAAQGAGCYCV